jgi:glutamine---fructose-6-phosphate transaminase (isomerizing)
MSSNGSQINNITRQSEFERIIINMCGIVGYIGKNAAVDVLIAGLSKLEYRGYDSVGISLFQNSKIITQKSKGRIDDMVKKIDLTQFKSANTGIGHTRWATHGEPSDINSHPHGTPRITLVHNGIIENYMQVKERMIRKGYTFESETDTEALAKCLDYYYVQKQNPILAIKKVLEKIRGSYALGMMFADHPDAIYAVRHDSPLIIGLGEDENFIASDMTALLRYTRRYYLLEHDEIAIVKKNHVIILNVDGEEIHKEVQVADWDEQTAEKGGFPHFMIKEIHEQPEAFMKTLRVRRSDKGFDFSAEKISDEFLKGLNKIHMVACGTAMHSGIIAKYLFERFARINVEVDVASEFRYRNPVLHKDDLVLIISQSGETADSLAALRLAKAQGVKTLAIVNVNGSSIAREADVVLMTHAGIEIAVASTKAYFVQVGLLSALALHMAKVKGAISQEDYETKVSELLSIEEVIKPLLAQAEHVKFLASQYINAKNLFFIGRGLDYAVSMEASLKLKEISYVHSEAYPGGELKHGTISLITDDVPVIALTTQSDLLEKTVSNVKEVKARGARVLLLKKEDMNVAEDVADDVVNLPSLSDWLMPFTSIIIMQLFAYYSAVLRGCDVDKPRNLAKSVTVE